VLPEEDRYLAEHDLAVTVSSAEEVTRFDAAGRAAGKPIAVHLKIDTGMGRIGVQWYSAQALLEESLRCRRVRIEGIFTHLANADSADATHARLQLERFAEVLRFYERRSLPTPLRHAASSGAILQLPESHLDLVRPGILFYGASPAPELPLTIPVGQAARWTTRVVFFKVVKPGNPVSYGSEWTPAEPTRVVTLPVGYGDGYGRAMSGRAQVLLNGKRYPVVGRICMDQVMVSIGWDSAYNGDEAVLLGAQGEEAIRIEELAGWAGTIAHEVLTTINTRVPRVYRGG
jgi:alanine racemase